MTKQLHSKDKVRSIRISSRVWSKLKALKIKGKSWNLLFDELIRRFNKD